MQYMVMGVDGKEYGPVSYDDLKVWVTENRLTPQSQVRDFNSGASMIAQAIPGLFPNNPAPAFIPSVSHSDPAAPPRAKEEMGPFLGVIIRSVLAFAIFYFFHGAGIIVGGYTLFYAIQLKSQGSRYGIAAILIAIATLALLGIGWAMRLSGANI